MTELVDAAEAENSTALIDRLDLEVVDRDVFRTRVEHVWSSRLFGGEVCAQALVAAERTVSSTGLPHSLHAYFLRPGDPSVPVDFRVDRLHDGGTFCRRRVTATQYGRAILCLDASFTGDHDRLTGRVPVPDMRGPERCPPYVSLLAPNIESRQMQEFDIRTMGQGAEADTGDIWFRARNRVDGRVSAAAVLTYFSDFTLIAVILSSAEPPTARALTSLDHVMWFHNEVRLDDWLYYQKSAPAVGDLRGLAQGRIFNQDGTLIASIAQEGLIHRPRA
ncbi:acyl-CoA thioesterase domain-containing protein [Nocardia sp. NPDC005366]|uniref:acyl-CoA thioesterase n=1 Tax=Nocardia sp. NPDC005366 TaxID=3156878 RepID=UPI0033A5C8A7